MSETIDIWMLLHTREMEEQISVVQEKIDETERAWREAQSIATQGMSVLFGTLRQVIRLTGDATDEVGRAQRQILTTLLASIQATASTALAIGVTYLGTGMPPLQAAGAILIGFSTGLSLGQAARVIELQTRILNEHTEVASRIDRIEGRLNTFEIGGAL